MPRTTPTHRITTLDVDANRPFVYGGVNANTRLVDASDIGLGPDATTWPDFIRLHEDAHRVTTFARPAVYATQEVVRYSAGSLELHVIND